MSFMFNPHPFDDKSPVNCPDLSDKTVDSIVEGTKNVALHIADKMKRQLQSGKKSSFVLAMDGYVGAEWEQCANLLAQALSSAKISTEIIDVSSCCKSSVELDKMLSGNLPNDRKKDPVLLFGKLFDGGFESLFQQSKLDTLKETSAQIISSVRIAQKKAFKSTIQQIL